MKKAFRILFFTSILTSQMFVSFADRGVGKKKNKIVLNIKSTNSFPNSFNFNLNNGMKYTGSIINNTVQSSFNNFNSLVTYQKGNSVYIVPIKQKIFVADARQGFAGTKLIIKVH